MEEKGGNSLIGLKYFFSTVHLCDYRSPETIYYTIGCGSLDSGERCPSISP